jgi:small-conductance mechanosensitive channel
VGLYLLLYPTGSLPYELAMIYLPPIFVIRLAFIALHTIYSPRTPHLRISPQNCPSAAVYFVGLMGFIGISLFMTRTFLFLRSQGMSEGVFLLLYSNLGLLQFLILLAIPWMDRGRINRILLETGGGTATTPVSTGSRIKRLWFPLACLGLLGFELLWQFNLIVYRKDLVLPLLLTILSIPFGFMLFSIGNRLLLIAAGQTELMDPRVVNRDILTEGTDISKFLPFELPPEPASAADGEQNESPFRRHPRLVRNLMGILITCALFFWVLKLWGLDLPLGRSVFHSALSIFATLLLAYVVWEICRAIIDRKLEEDRTAGENTEEVEEGGEGSRKETLLTLLRKVIMALITVIVVLISLNAVGINIGPLLLSKIKSQGVREMDDSAMILRVKFKTKPGDQFVVRRELYRRIQERFRAAGVEFAHKNVTVYLPPEAGEFSGIDGAASQKLIEAGAAAAVSASELEEGAKKPEK